MLEYILQATDLFICDAPLQKRAYCIPMIHEQDIQKSWIHKNALSNKVLSTLSMRNFRHSRTARLLQMTVLNLMKIKENFPKG